jgi:hypothetical protein
MTTAIPELKDDSDPNLNVDVVRAIFESVYDNKRPPPGIDFKIMPVGTTGHDLSPPPHEYEGNIISLRFIDICSALYSLRLKFLLIFRSRRIICLSQTD